MLLLTGTPALNKPKELFQQLAALVPSAKIKQAEFGARYCQVRQSRVWEGGVSRHVCQPSRLSQNGTNFCDRILVVCPRVAAATSLTSMAAHPTWG